MEENLDVFKDVTDDLNQEALTELDSPPKPGKPIMPQGQINKSKYRSKLFLQIDALGEERLYDLYAAVMKQAEGGCVYSQKMILDRLLPVRKGARLKLNLPTFQTLGDLNTATNLVLESMSAAKISPEEALMINENIESRRKVLETEQIYDRLKALEARLELGATNQ